VISDHRSVAHLKLLRAIMGAAVFAVSALFVGASGSAFAPANPPTQPEAGPGGS
jgi:hypothetical protein